MKVVVPKWSSETRDAPLADGTSYACLLEVVLNAADGSMTAKHLAEILVHRLDHVHAPLYFEQTIDAAPKRHPSAPDASVAAQATVTAERAHQFFDSMDDRERLVMATRHLSSRKAAPTVGLGHAQVSNLRNRLDPRLRVYAAADDDPHGCVAQIHHHCLDWVEDETVTADPTSTTTANAREEENPR